MVAVVIGSWPDEKLSRLSGIGVNSEIPAQWKNVENAKPRELHVGEVVEMNCRRNAGGQACYTNIRILTGRAERIARRSPALNPNVNRSC